MPLNGSTIFRDMVGAAAQVAGSQWGAISSAVTVELQGLASRIVLITEGYLKRELSRDSAKRHLQLARFHAIATIAMLTSMVQAAAQRMVNAALGVVKDAVNTAAGFVLL